MIQPPRLRSTGQPPKLWMLLVMLAAVIGCIWWLQHYSVLHGGR